MKRKFVIDIVWSLMVAVVMLGSALGGGLLAYHFMTSGQGQESRVITAVIFSSVAHIVTAAFIEDAFTSLHRRMTAKYQVPAED